MPGKTFSQNTYPCPCHREGMWSLYSTTLKYAIQLPVMKQATARLLPSIICSYGIIHYFNVNWNSANVHGECNRLERQPQHLQAVFALPRCAALSTDDFQSLPSIGHHHCASFKQRRWKAELGSLLSFNKGLFHPEHSDLSGLPLLPVYAADVPALPWLVSCGPISVRCGVCA